MKPIDKVTIKVNVEGVIKDAFKNVDEIKACVSWNKNETLTVSRIDETIDYDRNVYGGTQISLKYRMQDFIKELFEDVDAETLFSELEHSPDDIILPENEAATYEITVEAEGMETRSVKGFYYKENLPTDYAYFINLIGHVFDNCGVWGYIFDPSIFFEPTRRKSDLIYIAVRFGEYGREYHYITDDDTIEEDDTVIVPVGKNNRETKAVVVEKRYCREDDAPYPLSKIKKVIRKAESVIEITPEFIESLVGKRIRLILKDGSILVGVVNDYSYDGEEDELDFYLQTDEENVFIEEYEIRKIELIEEEN